jgi:hypothetical protein
MTPQGRIYAKLAKTWRLSGVKTKKPLTGVCKWFIFWAPLTAESCNRMRDFFIVALP